MASKSCLAHSEIVLISVDTVSTYLRPAASLRSSTFHLDCAIQLHPLTSYFHFRHLCTIRSAKLSRNYSLIVHTRLLVGMAYQTIQASKSAVCTDQNQDSSVYKIGQAVRDRSDAIAITHGMQIDRACLPAWLAGRCGHPRCRSSNYSQETPSLVDGRCICICTGRR